MRFQAPAFGEKDAYRKKSPEGRKFFEKEVISGPKFRQKSPYRQIFVAYRQDLSHIAKFRPLFCLIAQNFCLSPAGSVYRQFGRFWR